MGGAGIRIRPVPVRSGGDVEGRDRPVPRDAGVPIEEPPCMLGAVFAEKDEDWASRRRFTVDSIAKAYGKNAGTPAASCTGDARERARCIIELMVADNPIGRKAA